MRKTLLSAVAALVAGCASIQIPPEKLTASEGLIHSAEAEGAGQTPEGQLQLQLAKDQVASAKELAAQGDDRAMLVLARAHSDAELALEKARAAKVHSAALSASQELAKVKAEGGAK